jgi:hypothetical protein
MKTQKRTPPKSAWKKGDPSPNPKGRPRDGESWAAIIKSVGDMYPTDILAFIGENNDLGRALKQYPASVQMKYLVTARVFSALMFEPTSGLWKELMERAEGKVTDKVDLSNTDGTLKPPQIIEIIKTYEKPDDATN